MGARLRGAVQRRRGRGRRESLPVDGGAPTPCRRIAGRAIREKRTVLVSDVTQDPEYIPLVAATRSEVAVPIVSGDDVVASPEIVESGHISAVAIGIHQCEGPAAQVAGVGSEQHRRMRLQRAVDGGGEIALRLPAFRVPPVTRVIPVTTKGRSILSRDGSSLKMVSKLEPVNSAAEL